jgi:putative acetyltransferase
MTISVRRATVDDAAAFARTMGDPRVYGNLMQLPYTNEAIWRTRLADMAAPGKSDLLLVAEREVDGRRQIVGSAGLHPVATLPRRRHVAAMGISVVPEAWRQGVGTALMQALCEVADRWMQIRRMHLDVYTDNAAAIALYRKHGFEIEGTHRAYALRDGVYVDVHAMARLHPQPPAIR